MDSGLGDLLRRKVEIPMDLCDAPVAQLRPSTRLSNVLSLMKIRRLGDLQGMAYRDVLKQRLCGAKTLGELAGAVDKLVRQTAGHQEVEGRPPMESGGTVPIDISRLLSKRIGIPVMHRDTEIADMALSVRLTTVLAKMNIQRMGDLHGVLLYRVYAEPLGSAEAARELADVVANLTSQSDERTKQPHKPTADARADDVFYIPVGSRGWPLHCLPVSNQLLKVLSKAGIRCLADMQKLTLSLLGLSRRSVPARELVDLVREVQHGSLEWFGAPHLTALGQVVRGLTREIAELDLHRRLIFVDRLSSGQTLGDVALRHELTKERIRQIERKALDRICDGLGPCMHGALEAVTRWQEVEMAVLTPAVIESCAGTAGLPHAAELYVRAISLIAPEIVVKREMIPRRHPLAEVTTLQSGLLDAIAAHLRRNGDPASAKDLWLHLRSAAPALAPLAFLRAVLDQTRFPTRVEADGTVLVLPAVSSRAERVIEILDAALHPLRPEEILSEAEQRFGPGSLGESERSLAAFVSSHVCGVYCLGKRAFGLRKHFQLPPDMWETVRDDFVACLQGGRRPLSTVEVVATRRFAWCERTNAHELAEILRPDPRLRDLGRFLFASASWGNTARELLRNIVPKVLETYGKPMTAKQIGDEIRKHRSVAANLMPSLIRKVEGVRDVGHGYFALGTWRPPSPAFFVTKPRIVARVVARREPPLRFGELCAVFDVGPTSEGAQALRKTLSRLRRVHIVGDATGPDALLLHDSWPVGRLARRLLAQSDRPLTLYEIRWHLRDRYDVTFAAIPSGELASAIESTDGLLKGARGQYLLAEHLASLGIDASQVSEACVELLSSRPAAMPCDTILAQLGATTSVPEDLTESVLGGILRAHAGFEEVAKNVFRRRL